MLFSGKENIFKCLVAFQKMLWKIFSGVWLYCWKYHRKHIFSAAKQIYNFILNPKTQINPEKKFIIRPNWEKKEEREDDRFWGRGWSVLGCDDRDRGRRIGAATTIAIDAKGRSRSGMTNLGRGRSVLGCDENDRFWVDRYWGATISPVVRSARLTSSVLGFLGSSESVLGSSEFGLFFLSLSLSLSAHGRVSLSLSSLSIFQKMGIWR